jgi:hypothetical protein
MEDQQISVSKFYFVDEAGDPTLFNSRGNVIVGTEGCSSFFILGLLDVVSPELLGQELENLRKQLLKDPYFSGVPSMQPERRKTAIAFHAKDDIPEVRREVFKLLVAHDVRFYAVIRDKSRIAQMVRQRNLEKPNYRYHPNQLYDRCVTRLFKERLHKDDSYRIVFARRGAADRTDALKKSLGTARENFRRSWGIKSNAPIEVIPSISKNDPCLQAVDYFLWALQRLYERREDRYLNFVWPKVGLVHDVDDVRVADYGVYYTQKNVLTLAKLQAK